VRALALLLVCALVALALPLRARTAESPDASGAVRLHEQAVAAYRDGDLATAEGLWREALDAPLAPADRARVLYDLGNVAWRGERPLEATAWYTAALRLAPRDEDVWRNLELARARAGLEPADRGDMTSTLRKLPGLLDPREARLAALAGIVLLALVLAGEALRGGAVWRWLAVLCVPVALVLALPWTLHALRTEHDPVMVVAEDGAKLRAEPNEALGVVGELVPGARAERVDRFGAWARIRTPDGELGWLRAAAVHPLDWRAAP
jgi:tetratricopeptide (TPR) repeat protein